MKIKEGTIIEDELSGLKIVVEKQRLHIEIMAEPIANNQDFFFTEDGEFEGTGTQVSIDEIPERIRQRRAVNKMDYNTFTEEQKEARKEWMRQDDVMIGYGEDMRPLENWQEHGMVCPYEHCIDASPLTHGPLACPKFGRDCPGGIEQVRACWGQNEDDKSH